jgi:hypothetical protein
MSIAAAAGTPVVAPTNIQLSVLAQRIRAANVTGKLVNAPKIRPGLMLPWCVFHSPEWQRLPLPASHLDPS